MKNFIKLGEERVPVDNISKYTDLGFIKVRQEYQVQIEFYNEDNFYLISETDSEHKSRLLQLDRIFLVLI